MVRNELSPTLKPRQTYCSTAVWTATLLNHSALQPSLMKSSTEYRICRPKKWVKTQVKNPVVRGSHRCPKSIWFRVNTTPFKQLNRASLRRPNQTTRLLHLHCRKTPTWKKSTTTQMSIILHSGLKIALCDHLQVKSIHLKYSRSFNQ